MLRPSQTAGYCSYVGTPSTTVSRHHPARARDHPSAVPRPTIVPMRLSASLPWRQSQLRLCLDEKVCGIANLQVVAQRLLRVAQTPFATSVDQVMVLATQYRCYSAPLLAAARCSRN